MLRRLSRRRRQFVIVAGTRAPVCWARARIAYAPAPRIHARPCRSSRIWTRAYFVDIWRYSRRQRGISLVFSPRTDNKRACLLLLLLFSLHALQTVTCASCRFFVPPAGNSTSIVYERMRHASDRCITSESKRDFLSQLNGAPRGV